jgi:hypothetical protein
MFQNKLIDCSAPQLRNFIQATNKEEERQLKEETGTKRTDIINKDSFKIPEKIILAPKEIPTPQISLNVSHILPKELKTIVSSKRIFVLLVEYQENKKKMTISVASIEELKTTIAENFEISTNEKICIEQFDKEFNEWIMLENLSQLAERDKIRFSVLKGKWT